MNLTSKDFSIGDKLYLVDHVWKVLKEAEVVQIGENEVTISYKDSVRDKSELVLLHKLVEAVSERKRGIDQYFYYKSDAVEFMALDAEERMETLISEIAKKADKIHSIGKEYYAFLSNKSLRKLEAARYIQFKAGLYKKKKS